MYQMNSSAVANSSNNYYPFIDSTSNEVSQHRCIIVNAFPLVEDDIKIQTVKARAITPLPIYIHTTETIDPQVHQLFPSSQDSQVPQEDCCDTTKCYRYMGYSAAACILLFIVLVFLGLLIMPIFVLTNSFGINDSEKDRIESIILLIIFTPLELGVIFAVIALTLVCCADNW